MFIFLSWPLRSSNLFHLNSYYSPGGSSLLVRQVSEHVTVILALVPLLLSFFKGLTFLRLSFLIHKRGIIIPYSRCYVDDVSESN